MYTYESFEAFGTFTLLRPIFITFLIISIILFLIMVLPIGRKKLINGFTIISISIISILVSAQVLFYNGIIVDEINLGGDALSTYIFLAIIGFSLLNPIIHFSMHRGKGDI